MRRELLRSLSAASLAAAVVLGASSAGAQGYYGQNQVQYRQLDWRVLRTEHFDVHYYPQEAAGAKIAARMAERSYARLSRLLNYSFKERKPIVIFASRGDFAQSNVFGDLGEGTGGVTDFVHQRNTFFLSMDLTETEHVMTHEMVHQFQYDVYARGHSGNGIEALVQNGPPLWWGEGMAEYLSIGPNHPATDAVIRDAALNGNLPTIKQMTDDPGRWFPYRYGESFWRWIGQRWGDEIIGEILAASPTLGIDRAFKRNTGFDLSELGDEWKETMQTTYLPGIANLDRPRKVAQPLLNEKRTGGIIPEYLAPALSPNGQQIAFISSGSLLRAEVFMDLYLADATNGKRIKRLTTSTLNPEFEELRYAYSQSSFSPDGRTLAFTAQTGGKDVIYLENIKNLEVERRLDTGLEGMIGPTWSPDGKQIIFSGAKGGFTNLYKIDVDGRNLQQITTGDWAALMPAWSPDGRRVAFVSDRGPNTDFRTLKFGKWQINILDLQTGNIDVIPGQAGKNLNPQWAPDGKSLAFISDRTGIAQLFIYDFDAKEHYQITKFIGGVQSVTENTPAISWARQADKIAFTYMDNNDFTIWSLSNPRQLKKEPYREPAKVAVVAQMSPADSAVQRASQAAAALDALAREEAAKNNPATGARDSTNGRRVSVYRGPSGLRPSADLPAAGQPGSESPVSVAALLDSAALALPNPSTFTDEPYKASLKAEAVQRPSIGYAQDNYGRGVFGGTGIIFGDLLGNKQLITAAAINGRVDEAQLFLDYVSLSRRLSWSAGFQQQPYFFLGNASAATLAGNQYQVSEELNRFIIRSAFFTSIYPKNRFQRFEIGLSATNIDRSIEYVSQIADLTSGFTTGAFVDSVKGTGAFDFASPYVAYVSDNALFNGTGTGIYGHRYRYQVGANVGTQNWTSYVADLRRYDAIIFSYLTLATHLYANVNVGPGETLFPQYLANPYQPNYVRGYDREAYLSSSTPSCGAVVGGAVGATSSCGSEQLLGSRTLAASVELRVPLIRRFDLGFIPLSMPPIDGEVFYDAGMAWSAGQSISLGRPTNYDPNTMRYPLRSFGYGFRINVFNIALIKIDYAIPHDSFNTKGYWWWTIGQAF